MSAPLSTFKCQVKGSVECKAQRQIYGVDPQAVTFARGVVITAGENGMIRVYGGHPHCVHIHNNAPMKEHPQAALQKTPADADAKGMLVINAAPASTVQPPATTSTSTSPTMPRPEVKQVTGEKRKAPPAPIKAKKPKSEPSPVELDSPIEEPQQAPPVARKLDMDAVTTSETKVKSKKSSKKEKKEAEGEEAEKSAPRSGVLLPVYNAREILLNRVFISNQFGQIRAWQIVRFSKTCRTVYVRLVPAVDLARLVHVRPTMEKEGAYEFDVSPQVLSQIESDPLNKLSETDMISVPVTVHEDQVYEFSPSFELAQALSILARITITVPPHKLIDPVGDAHLPAAEKQHLTPKLKIRPFALWAQYFCYQATLIEDDVEDGRRRRTSKKSEAKPRSKARPTHGGKKVKVQVDTQPLDDYERERESEKKLRAELLGEDEDEEEQDNGLSQSQEQDAQEMQQEEEDDDEEDA